MDKIIINLNRVNEILALRKSEQLLFFELVKLIYNSDENNNALVIVDSEERCKIAERLNVEVLSLNATFSRLVKKGIIERRTNGVYTIDSSLVELI